MNAPGVSVDEVTAYLLDNADHKLQEGKHEAATAFALVALVNELSAVRKLLERLPKLEAPPPVPTPPAQRGPSIGDLTRRIYRRIASGTGRGECQASSER